VECYFYSSMGEHLRQYRRSTEADHALLRNTFALAAEGNPRVRHLVVADGPDVTLLHRLWQG